MITFWVCVALGSVWLIAYSLGHRHWLLKTGRAAKAWDDGFDEGAAQAYRLGYAAGLKVGRARAEQPRTPGGKFAKKRP